MMTADKNWTLNEIIYLLKSTLGLAGYELSLITDADQDKETLQGEEGGEVTNTLPVKLLKNTPIDKRNAPKFPRSHYGMYNFPIHYTMGRGVPEALGDDTDEAVFRAFHEASGAGDLHSTNHREFTFKDAGITTEMLWETYGQCAYLHLELVRTDYSINIDEIMETPPGRPWH